MFLRFFGLDVDDYGLVPVHCEVWAGFVFVNFDDTAAPLAVTSITLSTPKPVRATLPAARPAATETTASTTL